MLYVSRPTLGEAYHEALRQLMENARRYDDPEIFREDAATIVVTGGSPTSPLAMEGGRLKETFPYAKFFPHVNVDLVAAEMDYWNDQFCREGKLDGLIQYLRDFPLSKRAIIMFWEDRYRDLSKGAVCEIAATFRLKNGALEMHTHMRANNAAFLLYMDMRVLMGVQRLVAEALGATVGDYVHFIDSLHVYDAERKAAARQLELTSSPVCRRALD